MLKLLHHSTLLPFLFEQFEQFEQMSTAIKLHLFREHTTESQVKLWQTPPHRVLLLVSPSSDVAAVAACRARSAALELIGLSPVAAKRLIAAAAAAAATGSTWKF